MNGSGSDSVLPSTEICCSFIASSSADCVFGVVRLISSASRKFVKIGPGLNRTARNERCRSVTPSTSEGSMSLVNCRR